MTVNPEALTRKSFETSDLKRGQDGEWYHLPTLRALHALGRLPVTSAGYILLMELAAQDNATRARISA